MLKRLISVGTSGILICSGLLPFQQTKVFASGNTHLYTNDNDTRTAGLIYQYHNSVSTSNGYLTFTAWTSSRNTMSYIGMKNISVQRSSNGSSWTEEKTITDKLKQNSKSHSLSDYPISVIGGYYYRIVCDHYADNGSGTTQSVSSTSNSVWIS